MGNSFSFEIDISPAVAQLGALRDAMVEGSKTAVDQGGDVLARSIKAAAPRGATGDLGDSVTKFPVTSTGHGWQVLVGPTVDYAKIREFGGSIRAKNVGHLKFTSDGRVHFPREVHQRGTHYIEAGARLAQGPAIDVMTEVLNSVIDGVTDS